MNPSDHKAIARAQSPELPLADFPAPHSSGVSPPENVQGAGKPGGLSLTISKLRLLDCQDDPPTPADIGFGQAADDVLAERLRQIAMGHTRESDATKPVYELLAMLPLWLNDAQKAWPPSKSQRDAPAVRLATVKLAATAIALIDRIDFDHKA